jgi:hypothetical protein
MARDILSVVRNLLAKAEDKACTPQEAEAFFAKAQAMMTKHAIESHLLGVADAAQAEKIISVIMFRDDKSTMLVKAKRELINFLADVNNCRTVMHGRAYMTLMGHTSDVELVQMLFNSLMLQLQTMLLAAENAGDVRGVSGRVSYAHGYVRRLYTRMLAAKRASQDDAQASTAVGNALVLRDRTALVVDHMNTVFPKLGHARANTSADPRSAAYGVGHRDGGRADLGGSRLTGGQAGRSLGN